MPPSQPATPPAAPNPEPADNLDFDLEPAEELELEESSITSHPPAAPAASPADSLPPHLLRRARAMGLEAEDLVGMSVEELREELRDIRLERAIASRAPAPAAAAAQALALPAATPQRDEFDRFLESFDLGQDDEEGRPRTARDLDPGILRLIKHQAQQIDGLRQALDQQTQARQAETMDQWIDRQFERLGASYESVIGKGGRREIAPKSPEYGRRLAILREAQRLAGANASPEDQIRLIPQAAAAIFGTFVAAPPPPPLNPTPTAPRNGANGSGVNGHGANGSGHPNAALEQRRRDWEAGGLARPTQRRGAAEPAGRDKAIKEVAEYLRDSGALEPTTLEEFPTP